MDWYVCEATGRGTYRFRVRWWHPGFWAEAYAAIRESGCGVFESLYWAAKMVRTFAKKR